MWCTNSVRFGNFFTNTPRLWSTPHPLMSRVCKLPGLLCSCSAVITASLTCLFPCTERSSSPGHCLQTLVTPTSVTAKHQDRLRYRNKTHASAISPSASSVSCCAPHRSSHVKFSSCPISGGISVSWLPLTQRCVNSVSCPSCGGSETS